MTNANALKAAQDKIAELEKADKPESKPAPGPGGNLDGDATGTTGTGASGNTATGISADNTAVYGAAALMAVAALGAVAVIRRRKQN